MRDLTRNVVTLGLTVWAYLAVGLVSRPSVAGPRSSDVTYSLTITMQEDTVHALERSGFSLHCFKAVGSSDLAGLPLVWFETRLYSLKTVLSWREQYQAYTQLQDSSSSVAIQASASYDIASGQVLQVQDYTGTGTVSSQGNPGVISIQNETTRPFTCGISTKMGSVSAPICTFPLPGKGLQAIVPGKQVLLIFTTEPAALASPVTRASGPGILIDFHDANARTVAFDINTGWNWGGLTWAKGVPIGSDLVPLLIKRELP